jgi:hypothetical protein
MGVVHGADDCETITGVRHVQVRKQCVEVLCRDVKEGIAYIRDGDYLEAIALQNCS